MKRFIDYLRNKFLHRKVIHYSDSDGSLENRVLNEIHYKLKNRIDIEYRGGGYNTIYVSGVRIYPHMHDACHPDAVINRGFLLYINGVEYYVSRSFFFDIFHLVWTITEEEIEKKENEKRKNNTMKIAEQLNIN